jgi:hypothetical protein
MVFRKKLSKRAQKLLDEINASTPKTDAPKSSLGNKNELTIVYQGSPNKFSPIKYRNLAGQNKMFIWSFIYLVLGASILFVSNVGWGQYQAYSKKVSKSEQKLPKVLSEIIKIEKNAKKIQKNIFDKKQLIQDRLEKIPTESMADELVNQVAILLENGDLKIVKQEIQVNKMITPVTFSTPPIQKPAADSTIFSAIVVPDPDAEPVRAKDKKNVAEKISGKKMRKGKKDKNAKEDIDKNETLKKATNTLQNNYGAILDIVKNKEAQRKAALMSSLPKNVSFMTYHFQLKGQYLDYLKARQHLIATYPYLIIPVEEIVTEKNQDEIQFRVIYDIPFFTENNTLQSNNKGT